MGFRLTAQADRDVIETYLHGARHFGRAQAERYAASLTGAFALIAAHPHLARERVEFRPPVRVHFHDQHAIVYLTEPAGVLILRVLAGRRDWEAVLTPSPRPSGC